MDATVLALLAGAIAASASSTVALTSDLPTAAVHLAVGDVITVTLPPAVLHTTERVLRPGLDELPAAVLLRQHRAPPRQRHL